MKLTLEQKQQINNLYNKGYSTREICKELFGDKETRRTTVRNFLKGDEVVLLCDPLYDPSCDLSKKGVKIFSGDIETTPALTYTWGRYDQNIGESQVIKESHILSYSFKELNNDNILCDVLTKEEVLANNDYRLCNDIYKILDEADIIIYQNGIKFDRKHINTRLLYHGFTPPSPYKIIDTYQIAKKEFKFPSSALDSMSNYLFNDRKIKTNFELWRGCMEGNEESLEKMLEYNIKDTILCEQVYLKFAPWSTNHPNLQVYLERPSKSCSICGSETFEETDKFYYTNLSKFPVYRCKDCGKMFRDRKNVLQERDKLFVGI